MADERIFGGKASEPETYRPVEKNYLPHLHLAPSMGVIPSEFHRDLLRQKTHRVPRLSCDVAFAILRLTVFVELSTRDGRTDGQTHDDSKYRASNIAVVSV